MLDQQQKFTKEEIDKYIQEIRSELFPSDISLTFTDEYCQCLDFDSSKMTMFQGYFRIPLNDVTLQNRIRRSKNNKHVSRIMELVFLSSRSMLNQLCQNKKWYIDATFKTAPKDFYQLLNIIVLNETMNKFIPAAHILMTHKDENAYLMVFSHLQTVCRLNSLKADPKSGMMDFEKSLRNAFKKVFPEALVEDCYFHFSKAIWKKANRNGLRKSEYRDKCILLVCFLKIISYCDPEKQQKFFKDLQELYKTEDPKFKILLTYFEKQWLGTTFIKPNPADPETKLARTNNACESFHAVLSKRVPMKRPQASVLIHILKIIEFDYRSMIVDYSQGHPISGFANEEETVLPFQKILDFAQEQLPRHEYNPKSLTNSSLFMNKAERVG